MLANKLIKPNRNYQKKGDLRFSTKKYSNPFFNERKKIKNKRFNFEVSLKIKIVFFSFTLLIISVFFLIFYSNVFQISEIEINGQGRVSEESIRSISEKVISQRYIKFFPYKNIIIFSKNKLIEELEQKYAFDELDIKKDYPNKIIISYKEKSYAFVLEENDNYFYLDIDGYVVDEANVLEISKQLYPIIKNQTKLLIENKKTTINMQQIGFILEIFEELKKLNKDILADNFIIDSELKTIKLDLENGPIIYFNIDRGVSEQIEKLVIVKDEKIKDDFSKKEYIDLRYGDSVYYR